MKKLFILVGIIALILSTSFLAFAENVKPTASVEQDKKVGIVSSTLSQALLSDPQVQQALKAAKEQALILKEKNKTEKQTLPATTEIKTTLNVVVSEKELKNAVSDSKTKPVVDDEYDGPAEAMPMAGSSKEKTYNTGASSIVHPFSARQMRKVGTMVRIGMPEGVGFGLNYTPIAPLTIGFDVSTLVATAAITAEAQFNILWNCDFTPIIEISFTQIRFTGLASDKLARNLYHVFYNVDNEPLTIDLNGKYVNIGSVKAGLEYIHPKAGLIFQARAGYFHQLGSSNATAPNGSYNFANNIQIPLTKPIFDNWNGVTFDMSFGFRIDLF